MVPCPLCESMVDWVTVTTAAELLGISEPYVRGMIKEGRFPNAEKSRKNGAVLALWKLPIRDVLAVKEARSGS